MPDNDEQGKLAQVGEWAEREACGFGTAANLIAIAYLRLGKLTHLPASPVVQAMPLAAGQTMRAA